MLTATTTPAMKTEPSVACGAERDDCTSSVSDAQFNGYTSAHGRGDNPPPTSPIWNWRKRCRHEMARQGERPALTLQISQTYARTTDKSNRSAWSIRGHRDSRGA